MAPVWPLQTVVFQTLFLLVVIAVEGIVLQRGLKLNRKTSMQQAASINLLSTIVGWWCFFALHDQLPTEFQGQMISYIFFDHFSEDKPDNFYALIAISVIAIFFISFIIKLAGLRLLKIFLELAEDKATGSKSASDEEKSLSFRRSGQRGSGGENRAMVVLIANSCSYSAILLLLFLRFLYVNPISG
ncbi:MAG: hypothetical protein F6K26_13595 [Moorea sp. SIO2I5]|nr:hypothetical protein [Moorena sp. SIO2I5]